MHGKRFYRKKHASHRCDALVGEKLPRNAIGEQRNETRDKHLHHDNGNVVSEYRDESGKKERVKRRSYGVRHELGRAVLRKTVSREQIFRDVYIPVKARDKLAYRAARRYGGKREEQQANGEREEKEKEEFTGHNES